MPFIVRFVEHIGVLFTPGRIVYFSDDCFQGFIGAVAVVEAYRIKAIAKVAQVSQQADGAIGAPTAVGLY